MQNQLQILCILKWYEWQITLNLLQTMINLNYKSRLSLHCTVNTLLLSYKNKPVSYMEIIAASSEIHTEHTNALYW